MRIKIGDACEFINGGSWTEGDYREIGIPVLKVSNFNSSGFSVNDISYLDFELRTKFKRNKLELNDIIIATVGSHPSLVNSAAGRTIRVNSNVVNYYLNQNAICLRVNENEIIDQIYLYYLTETTAFRNFIQQRGKGAANQMRIPISGIKDFSWSFAPLEMQKKIASILSGYDDLIENNLKRIKILEEMAQQTYEEWFVRMRFQGYETAEINAETGLPVGWEKVKLWDLGDVITGKTPSTLQEEYYNGHIPFIKTPDMNGSVYVLETNQYLTQQGSNVQKNKLLDKNDLVISCIGSAGAYALVSQPSQFNQQINAIRFKNHEYTYFTFCYSKGLKEVLQALGSNGATMTNVNKGKFEQIDITLPNKGLLKEFHQFAKPCFESILNLQNQNQRLRETRDILLPRLMMGMVEV